MPSGERHLPASQAQHLAWLDWVRFLAAATVVFGHVCGLNWDAWPAPHAAPRSLSLTVFLAVGQMGRQAVVVFFVLSGLLVGGKVVARVRTGTFDAAAYAADRLARVYVPFVPAILFTMAIAPFCGLPWTVPPYLRCVTGTQELFMHTPSLNAPLWTLAYEIWFYVLAGCLAVLCRRAGPWTWRIVAGAGAALAAWIFWEIESAYLLCWLLGAAGFWLRDRIRSARVLCAAGGLLVLLVGSVIYQIDLGLLAPVPGLPLLAPYPAQVIVAAGSLLLIAALMSMTPGTPGVRRVERAGKTFAAFSYTFYLTHYPVLYLLSWRMGRLPPAITWAATTRALAWLAACVLVALAMYWLFEARTPAARRWLRAKLEAV